MTPLPEFRLFRPAALDEALDRFAATPDSRWVAGGTDLVVNLRRGLGQPGALIDISGLAELQGIVHDAAGLRLGAAVTLAELAGDAAIGRDFTALAEAAAAVAGPTHRAAATLGGNLCLDTRCIHYNESDWWRDANDFCMKYQGEGCRVVPTSVRCHAMFAGDVAPALMVLGAEVEVAGPRGRRSLPLDQLYRDDGTDYLTLAPGELVVAVTVPARPGWRSGYGKTRFRNSLDFPLVGVAAALRRDGERLDALALAFTATNSRPLPIDGAAALVGGGWDEAAAERLAALVRKQINPLKTTTVTPRYRRRVAVATMRRLIGALWDA